MANCALSLVIWPGRDRLRHLAPLSSITQLASLLANELEETYRLTPRFYSPGTAWALRWRLKPADFWNKGLAQGLIISGCHAPHLHSRRQLSDRDDADFIAELIDIGGCSPELRKTRSYCRYFFLLRADFYATEHYHYDSPDVPPLRTPRCSCGSRDREASWPEMEACVRG
jgi:thioesterase component of yersiniabactin synthetase